MVDGLQKGVQLIVSENKTRVVDLSAYKLDCMMNRHAMVDDVSKNTSLNTFVQKGQKYRVQPVFP